MTAPRRSAQAKARLLPAPEPTPDPTPALTLEQYALAYRHISRPGWPPLEQCLRDHVRRTCLAGIARNLGRARWQPAPVATAMPQGLPVPPTPTAPPAKLATPRAPRNAFGSLPIPQVRDWTKRGVDLKRAAANDLDD